MIKWRIISDEYHNIDNLLKFHRTTMHHKANISVNHIVPVLDNLIETDSKNKGYGVNLSNGKKFAEDDSFLKILKSRRTGWEFKKEMSVEQLSDVLQNSFGVNCSRQFGEYLVDLRPYASAGALYSVEPYVYINNVDKKLDNRIWKYDAKDNSLIFIADSDIYGINSLTSTTKFRIKSFDKAKIVVFYVANCDLILKKYGMLAYRLVLLEAGHMCHNLQLVSTKFNYSSVPIGGFYDLDVSKLLRLDKEQICVYMAAVG